MCAACAWYLDNSAGHPAFLKMSLIVQQDSWRNWQRADMKADMTRWLTDGLDAESYLVVSLTKKKHILMQAPCNAASTRTLSIQVEENRATLDLDTWRTMDAAFLALLQMGHHKGEILSGTLYAYTLRKHGQVARALRLSSQLEPFRQSPELELLSYVTIVDEVVTQESEETSATARGTGDDEQTGAGDGDHSSRGIAAQSGLEPDRQRVQIKVSRRDMDAVRDQRGGSGTHEQHAPEVSQHALF